MEIKNIYLFFSTNTPYTEMQNRIKNIEFRIKILEPFDRLIQIQICNPKKMDDGLTLLAPESRTETMGRAVFKTENLLARTLYLHFWRLKHNIWNTLEARSLFFPPLPVLHCAPPF